MTGMGSHQSARMMRDEWLTPPEVLADLGPFDLDPSAPADRPWDMALIHYSADADGLSMPWFGRVWLNPPYGRHTGVWLDRLAAHGDGIALIFARTETAMFVEHVWARATALKFIHGRLHFHYVDGARADANAGAPSVLVAYGEENGRRLERSAVPGTTVWLRSAGT